MRTFFIPLFVILLTGMLFGCVSVPTPLVDAVGRGDSQAVRTLLDQGNTADIGEALVGSACMGNTEIAQLLLDRGADVNSVYHLPFGSVQPSLGFEYNSLQCASLLGHTEMVALLLKAGAPPDMKALKVARDNSYASIVRMLEEAQASPTATPPQRPALLPPTKESPPPPIY